MQVCECMVRLGGNKNHVVKRTDVTPAEILVLKQIHGTDAIESVKLSGKANDSRSHQSELERLRHRYDRSLDNDERGDRQRIVAAVFPGANPRLPATLQEIGIELEAVERKHQPRGISGQKGPRPGRRKDAQAQTAEGADSEADASAAPGDESGNDLLAG